MSSMSLNTEVGSFVIFTGVGGYPKENEDARERLSVGELYEVLSMKVGGWSSTVMTKLVQLLETNGINPEDALFYLSTYLQDQEVTEDE